jgi:hypothetical protein
MNAVSPLTKEEEEDELDIAAADELDAMDNTMTDSCA